MIEDVAFGIVLGAILLGILGAIVWLIFAFLGGLSVIVSQIPAEPKLSARNDAIVTAILLVITFLLAFFGDALLQHK